MEERGAPMRTYLATVRRVPRVSAGAVVMMIAGVLAITAAIVALKGSEGSAPWVLGAVALVLGGLGGLRLVRALAHPAIGGADSAIDVSEDGVVVRRYGRPDIRVRSGDLAAGYVQPVGAAGAFVHIEPHLGATLVGWMASIEDARELLELARLSAAYKPATFSFPIDMHVTVGADGVLVRWPMLRRRVFLSHERIDDVRWTNDRITLLLADGDSYVIGTGGRTKGDAVEPTDMHRALLERLLEARKVYVASDAGTQAATLARNDRTAEEWVKQLRTWGASGGQYRTAALPADALYRIATDAAAPEEQRIGAGLALRAVLDAEGRSRLRVAAESSASPRVRVALAAAADEDDDDDAVVAALEPRARRAR